MRQFCDKSKVPALVLVLKVLLGTAASLPMVRKFVARFRVVSAFNAENDDGIVPNKEFTLKSKYTKRRKVPTEDGILPVNRLSCILMVAIALFQSPIELGIVPDKVFVLTSKAVKE